MLKPKHRRYIVCSVNNKAEDVEYHENDKDTYKTEISNEIKALLPKITRKAKDILSEKSFGNKLASENGLKSYSNIDTIDDKLISDENVLRKASSNVYEVTERLPSIIHPVKDVSDNTEQVEYFYERPQLDKENLTNNFLNILSKYNIKVNDKLPNYALSRRNNDHNRFPTRLMHYPNNLRIPYGYNSLDHLPVDPILAVFLSNYGYYLPGMYGINRDYNNLYGYLASNNMHNNKPFGLYKIYSDTDSSN
ncbi:hypothetical protein K1T71_006892 [Dendrolimus kikuchii]|uniref:Uncharacterized protein n=1 Tax=Dendrolimus kikuchii TaxID=765133 RepID=A0ACC1D209_9NEOP|nr:hypothetical protein K1T71_006892 [Dendrolimus kikuchii]